MRVFMGFTIFLCFYSIYSTSVFAESISASNFSPAELIKNLNSKKPNETSSRSRSEGWVDISYLVDEQGIAGNLVVVDSSENDHVISQAHKYLSRLHFSPAIYNDQAVVSAAKLLFRTDKSFYGNPNDMVSRSFRDRYNKINKLLAQEKMEEVKYKLEKLGKNSVNNLAEKAMFAWIRSVYAYRQSEWLLYERSITTAVHLRYLLPTKMAMKATINLFEWYKYKKQYKNALGVLGNLGNIDNARMDPAILASLEQSIHDLVESEPELTITTSPTDRGVWLHSPTRATFSLSSSQGSVTSVELRCDNSHYKFSGAVVENYTIPEGYLNCTLLVKANPNTLLIFNESGGLHY